MRAEPTRCPLCGNTNATRQRDGDGNTYHFQCPACRHFDTDHIFTVVADQVAITDPYILAGYSRQQNDAGEAPPLFTNNEHIAEAARRQKRGEPAHPDLMQFVPANIYDKMMRILQEVKKRSEKLEFGEPIRLESPIEFPICYAKSAGEFQRFLQEAERRGFIERSGDMHGDDVLLDVEGEAALEEWLAARNSVRRQEDSTVASKIQIQSLMKLIQKLYTDRASHKNMLRPIVEALNGLDQNEFGPEGLVAFVELREKFREFAENPKLLEKIELPPLSEVESVLDKYQPSDSGPATAPSKSRSRVFIGHGRSPVWKDLKDFLHERLRLDWDEFNREPQAGRHTVTRLNELLDNALFAFIVMTAEDEHDDGKLHARENVVHEAGLFQGRLGFERAILLQEDGCETFSNIDGLTVIRFPKDNIEAKFEEVRRVLEREGILDN